jgi:hypothetical protein
VSLIQKKTSLRLHAANRTNSLQSTGPQTKLGKAHSSRNALKHGVLARLPAASMKQLGEDPAAFQQLVESLRDALNPRDGFEEMLVEDMAEIRWRRQRLMRAEAGILASKRRSFEIEREWKVADYGKGLAGMASDMLIADMGLAGLALSGENFRQITQCLEVLKRLVETKGFREEDSGLLKVVYGKTPSYTGGYLTGLFKSGQEGAKDEGGKDEGAKDEVGKDSEKAETNRRYFLEALTKEIASFRKLAELHYARDVEVSEPLMDSHLIPSQEDLSRIMEYETALERQFERKLQQLVAWRRAKGEGDRDKAVLAQ